MPIIDKGATTSPRVIKPSEIRLDIQDSEFLLRHLIESQYSGREVEQAFSTLSKIKEIHKKLMKASVEV